MQGDIIHASIHVRCTPIDAGGIKEFFPENSQLSFSNDNNRIDNLSDTINLINDYELLKIEGKNNKQFIEDKLNKNKLERMFSEIINE